MRSPALQDYPTIRPAGDPNMGSLAAERGANLKAAAKALPGFARWFEKSKWFGRMSADIAATYYCDTHQVGPTQHRWAFQQLLGQMYEQKALDLVRSYPGTLTHESHESKFFFFRLPKRSPKKTRAPAVVGG